MKPKVDIAKVLETHRGERHLVVLHDYPDPDAISAGYAHALISAEFGIDVDILYTGEVSHQQNIALVKLLGNSLIRFSQTLDMNRYQAAVFVDHQGTTTEEVTAALQAAGVPVLLVVDHHQIQDRLKPEFSEIQPVGSTATIYACYLDQGVIQMDTSRREHVLVATALVHGILTDTSGFVRAGADDLLAAAYLSRLRDAEVLTELMSQSRSKHTMEVIHQALENRVIVDNYSIAGLGYLRTEDRDAIPQAADFLLSEENVHTAIAYAIIRDGHRGEVLTGSLRTTKFSLDPDVFLKETLGRDSEGMYFGGGRPLAGGFSIPVGFLAGGDGKDYDELKWKVHDLQIKHRFFSKIGVAHETLEKKR